MPNVDLNHSVQLGLYSIELKKECKTSAVIRLKDSNEDIRVSRRLYDKLIYAIQNSNITQVYFPKIYFGIELEFVGSCNTSDLFNFNIAMEELVGTNDRGESKYCFDMSHYRHNNGNQWILGKDASIKYIAPCGILPQYAYGYELSSPKLDLFNKDHIQLVSNVLDLIKTHLHGEVNSSCGTHIHIGFSSSRKVDSRILQKILLVYSDLEKSVFDPIVPRLRRRNKYCKSTSSDIYSKYQKLSARYCELDLFTRDYQNLRFEFRQLEGTLDLDTIVRWATLQAYVFYDIFYTVLNLNYSFTFNDLRESVRCKNIFDILFSYGFDNKLINFFIERAIKFKSRSI